MKKKYAWVIVDLSNSSPGSKNYLWWFETRELARDHRRRQHGGAELSQPQRWIRDAEGRAVAKQRKRKETSEQEKIIEREYCKNSIVDLWRDIDEAVAEAPTDESGFIKGTFKVCVIWEPDT